MSWSINNWPLPKYIYILLYVIDGEVEKGGPTMFDFIDFVLTKYILVCYSILNNTNTAVVHIHIEEVIDKIEKYGHWFYWQGQTVSNFSRK